VKRVPAWGVRKIWALLRREGVIASRDRVWKTMQALGLTLPALQERAVPLRRGHVAVPDSCRTPTNAGRPIGRRRGPSGTAPWHWSR